MLGPVRRGALALGTALSALSNPANAESVAVFGELSAGPALRRLRQRLLRDPIGREMLETGEPARFPPGGTSAEALDALRGLPAGSLGAEYLKFMEARGFDPGDRLPVRFVEDAGDAWLVQRYRDVHDVWHVLTDVPTNLMGEIALKWFEAAHTGLPMPALAAVGAPLRLAAQQRALLRREVVPWAIEAAQSARDLLAIRYEDHLDQHIDDCRREWNVRMLRVSQPELLYGKKRWERIKADMDKKKQQHGQQQGEE